MSENPNLDTKYIPGITVDGIKEGWTKTFCDHWAWGSDYWKNYPRMIHLDAMIMSAKSVRCKTDINNFV